MVLLIIELDRHEEIKEITNKTREQKLKYHNSKVGKTLRPSSQI